MERTREVLDHVARDADELIGDSADAALIIDESAFVKQGKMSVGASRQYLGRLGKVDRGQVAVFGVLAKGYFATAIDTRLYLPKEWTDDQQRCASYGAGDDGDALHADRKTADERPMPFAKLRGYREAASGFPTAERRRRRASL